MSGFPKFGPLSVQGGISSVPLTLNILAGSTQDYIDCFGAGNKIAWLASSPNTQWNLSGTAPGVYLNTGVGACIIGGASGGGQFSSDSLVGDMCLTSGTGGGSIRLGVGIGTSTMQVTATSFGFKNLTTGIGNGASGNLTALAKGTGTGPASSAVNAWVPTTINGTAGWIPFFT